MVMMIDDDGSILMARGSRIALWLTRLTMDQKVQGLIPGRPFCAAVIAVA